MAKKLTTFSMRMPEDINERIQAYAAEHECTKAEAMSHFVRAGIDLEDNGPSTQGDVDLSAIEERLDGLRDATARSVATAEEARDAARKAADRPKPDETAIIPADIRDRVKAYSSEHECTAEEALGHFARLGVEMTAEQRPASAGDLAELSKKLDALAADGAAKNEQLKKLAETIDQIKGFTEPESVEVEGELADPAIEEAKDALEEERREAEQDERTRKIISEVMDSYIERSKPADPPQQTSQGQGTTILLPVLAAAVVALVIGIVIILLVQA